VTPFPGARLRTFFDAARDHQTTRESASQRSYLGSPNARRFAGVPAAARAGLPDCRAADGAIAGGRVTVREDFDTHARPE
jgi:hypothetical protein